MSDFNDLESETHSELKRIQTEIAAVGPHAKSVWAHWEPYLCLLVGLVLGFISGHWL